MTIIEHAESFDVRSADGQTVRRFPFDENTSRRAISGAMKRKQALQSARAFAGKGAVLIARPVANHLSCGNDTRRDRGRVA